MDDKKTRVRFAPSPTGQLHLGGARTALYNWLYAKKNNGKFLLRIEDTDKIRSKQEYTNQICDSLKWLGLEWDEELVFQSERTKFYKKAINTLIKNDKAYRCFCSKEKIAQERQTVESVGKGYLYPQTCRKLDDKIVKKFLEQGKSYSIRIKVPKGKTEFVDNIYGNIKVDNSEIDDFIIARSDGSPVYNLVVVVDDSNMSVTDVIRGEDHISNTTKQIIIYDALNLSIPKFAHLPMILGPDKKRLSKRHGATGVQEYRDSGYLPEALNNYLALLGWNPGTEQEVFNIDELIRSFTIERIQKKSAVFDEKKLEWMNKQYIKNTPTPKLYWDIKTLNNEWVLSKKDNKYLFRVIDLMKERVNNINEFVTLTEYFFTDPSVFDEKTVRKRWKDNSVNILIENFINELQNINSWEVENIENSLRNLSEKEEVSPGKIIHPTRLAISGISSGPSLFEMMELLGKNTCLRRLERANNILPN